MKILKVRFIDVAKLKYKLSHIIYIGNTGIDCLWDKKLGLVTTNMKTGDHIF